MSQSTRSRPNAEAGQSRSAAQWDGALAPGPPAGLVPKDHIPKRRRRGSGGVRVLAAVACLAWLAWPTEAVAQTYTITISAITFNDILDASEYSDGFNITGSTGTEQDITVDVTLGTKTWQTTSDTQDGGHWWWSVTVGTNATYITHGENEVTAEAKFPNNVELDHDRSFYAYLYAAPQINGDTQIQWAENTSENVEVGSYPVVYDDISLLGFDVSGADEDDFSVLQTYAADGSMSLSVVFEDSPDYEDPDDVNANNEYKFTLELVEAGQTLVSKNVTVTVTDEPAVSGSTAVQYAENGTGTVATYTTSETVTWSWAGADSSAFNISTGGALSFASPPDHENATDADTDNIYEVTVVATDGSESGRLDVSVTVTGVDEAPTAHAGTAETVAEAATVTLDGSGSSDPEGAGLTYSWSQTAPASGEGSGVELSSTTAQSPTFTAPTELSNDVTLTFSLTVNDGTNTSPAATVDVTVIAVPAAPTNLSATPSDGQVALIWTNPGNTSITKYQVSTDGGTSFSDIDGSGQNTTAHTVTELTNGTAYTLAVRAVNASGNGDESTVTVTMVPAAPTNLSKTPSDGQVALTWDDPGNTSITKYQVSTDGAANFSDIVASGATTTGHIVTDLTNGTAYTLAVRAVNASGNGAVSIIAATPNPVPTAPTNLSATPGDGQVTLSWNDPSNTSISKYQVSSDGGANFADIPASGASTTTHTVTSLTNGTDYTLAVRAVNASGNSDVSTVTVTMVPAAPAGLSATPGDGQVALSWTDPGNTSISKYQVSSDGGANFADIAASGASTTTHTVTGLTNGTDYTLAVRAVNASGNGAVATVGATPVAVPAAPSELIAWVGDTEVTLSWDDPSDTSIDKYQVSSDGGTSFADIPGSGATTTSHIVMGLTNYTAYHFEVRAVNASGNGTASAVSQTPVPVPAAPSGFGARPHDEQVWLYWDGATDTTITGYNLSNGVTTIIEDADTAGIYFFGLTNGTVYTFQLRAGNAYGLSPPATVNAAPVPPPSAPTGLAAAPGDSEVDLSWDDPNNPNINTYEVSSNGGSTFSQITLSLDYQNATITSHTVTGLTNGTAYTFALRAVNWPDYGAVSTTVSETPVPVPAAPADLSATAGNSQVTLSWTDPENNTIDKYQVSTDGGTSFADIAGSDADTASHTVTGLTNGTEYSFALRAANASGDGAVSSIAATPRAAVAGVPAAPVGLSATPGDAQVTLSWTDPGDDTIDNYQVSSDGGTSFADIAGSGATTTGHIVTGLTNGTAYTLALRAVNGSGDGAVSSIAATPVAVPAAPLGLTAAAGDAQVTLSWTDPGNDTITGYELRVDSGAWADIAGSDADTASHTVTGLTNGTEYSFALRAANASGDGAVSSIAATPRAAVAGVPAAPVGLSATPGDAQVTLSWTDPGDDTIDNYQISSDGGTSFADIAGSGATTTGHIVTGLTNGTAYTLALRAVNGSGDGAVSSIAATPVAVPAAPLGLTAAAGDAQVTLSWTDPGNDTITGYELRVDSGAWADIAGSDADTASHTVTGLTNGTEYSFALRAANASGDGAVSSIAATPRAAVAGVPAAPVGLSATPGDAQVTLSWTDPGDDTIDNYQISSDGGTSFADIAGSGATTTGHIVTGLTNGTAYTLALRAVNGSGDGAVSSIAATPVAVPAAPLGLTAAAGDAQVTLSWTDPGNDTITGYELRVDSGAWADIAGSDADTASHTVTGLTNGTEYSFALRAANASGDGAVSSIAATPRAAVAGVPAAPVGLSATPGDAQVTLSWTDPGDDTIDNYQVSSDGGTSFADIAGSGATTTGHIVTGLTNGTAYTLALRAVNGSGDGAVSSIAATPVAVPAAPLGLTAAAGDAQVTLSWTDPGNDTITGYELRVDSGAWADIAGSDADTASHTVTGLTNGTEYSFALRAANASGDGAVSSIAATPRAAVAGVPAAPVGLSATPGDAQVTLSWTDPGDDTIDNYQISSDGGTSFADIAGSGATTTGHIVTGLTNGTAYTLALRAVNGSGDGAVSSIAATPVAVPAAPLGLTAAAGDAQVTLSWTDPGNDTITGYELRVDSGAWADIAGSDADTASHTVTGLTNGTEYSFALRAANASGDGAVSSIAATPRAAVAGVPAAPVGLSATPGDAQVTLSWTDPGDDTIDNYQISSDGGTSFADIAGSGATTTGHIVTGLTNGTAYTLALRAVNGSGDGAVSSIAATPVAVPAAPLGLTAAAGDAQVTLSWTDPGNDTITGYELRVDSGAWADIAGSDADTASHTVTGLTNGTEYSFALRAANASGDGAVSSIAATPRAAVAGVPAAPVGLSATPGDAQVTLSWTDPGDDTIDNYQISSDGGTSFADIAGSGATTTGHIVTGLTNGTAYTLALRAVNGSGDGAVSSIAATPVAVPAAPLGLTAAAGDAQVTLSWTDPGNDTITGYELRVDSGAWADIAGSDADTASHTVTGLTNGTEYSFALRAANASGDGAVSSIAATPRAAVAGVPAAPVGLSATPGDAQVTLSWTDPGDDTIDNYQISSDGGTSFADIAGSGATTTGHIVTGLTNGTAYTLALRAVNGSGDGAVSSIAATPVAVPAAPLGLTAAAGDAQVTLSWTDPGNDTITGYELRVDSGAWADIAGSDADTASHTVTGLTNGTEYSFALRAANASGDGAVSSIAATPRAAVAGVPAAPVGLSATPGDAQVTLSWTDPGDATITKYQVSSDGGTSFADIAGSGATTTGHIVTGLTNGTAYTLALRAVNGSGDGAVSSIAATPVAVPAAPLGLTAAAGDAQVTLSWTDPGNDTITGYELRVDSGAWADIAGSDADTASHTVTGLTNGTEYSFALRAANASGDGAVSSIAATPRAAVAGVPAAPVGLSATPGDAQVTLSWTDPGDDTIDNYQISSDGGTSFADIAGSGATTTGHIVTGLTNGTAYTLALRAVNGSGDGAVSSIAATPVAVPAAPLGLTAAAGDAQVTLSWTDPGNDTITGYELRVDSGAWADIAGSDADTASHTVTGLTNGTEYSFALRAANASGDGAVSSIAATPRAAVAGVPAAPVGLSATPGDAQVTLSWTDPGDDTIDNYQVSSDGGTSFADIAGSGATTTGHIVTGLTNGTAYTLALRAVNGSGDGAVSSIAATPVAVPAAPLGLTAAAGDAQVTLSWTDPGNDTITGYELRVDSGAWADIAGSDADTASHTVTGLTNGTEYSFALRAANASGDGAVSSIAATPRAAVAGVPAAPVGLSATPGDAQVTLSWTDPGDDTIDNYQISSDGGTSFADIAGSGATTTGHIVTGLTNGTAYTLALRAVNGSGDGAVSSIAATPVAVPAAPLGLTAAAGDAQVTLSWTDPGNDTITGYELRVDSGAWADIAGSDADTASHTVTGLTNGTEYSFALRAANASGDGAVSSIAATPRAAVAGVPAAPVGLSATPGDAQVTLSWTDPGDDDDRQLPGQQRRRHELRRHRRQRRDHHRPYRDRPDQRHRVHAGAARGERLRRRRGVQHRRHAGGGAGGAARPHRRGRRRSGDAELDGPGQRHDHGLRAARRQRRLGRHRRQRRGHREPHRDGPDQRHRVQLRAARGERLRRRRGVQHRRHAAGGGGGGPGRPGRAVGDAGRRSGDAELDGPGRRHDRQLPGQQRRRHELRRHRRQRRDHHRPYRDRPDQRHRVHAGAARGERLRRRRGVQHRRHAGGGAGGAARPHRRGRRRSGDAELDGPGQRHDHGLRAARRQRRLGRHRRQRRGHREPHRDGPDQRHRVQLRAARGERLRRRRGVQHRRHAAGGGGGGPGRPGRAVGDAGRRSGDAELDGPGRRRRSTNYQVSSDGGTSFADIAGSGATTTGHIVTGLTNGTAYTLALRAANASGDGAVSSIAATPVAVPAAPLGLTAAAGDAQVTLSWTDPGNDTITGYELRVDSGAWADIAGSDADTASHTVTGLTNGTEYSFALRAANASGDGAVSSIAATPRAAVAGVPAAPVGLSATPGDAQVTLSWTDPGDDTIDNYQVSSDGGTSFADIAGSGATTTGHIVTGLTNGTAYTLALRAVNASGDGAVSSIAATPVAVPAAPLGLTAAAGDAQVTLSWTDPGNDTITGYELRVDSGAWADIAGSDADTASHTVTGLTNGTEYSFALRAANASGDGAVSSIAATPRAAVAGVPAAPVGLSATPGDAQVTLSWTDPGDATITKYQVSSDGGTSFADIAGSGATTTGHIVTGLTNGTAYTLALRAANASGTGAVSSIAATPVAVPAAPLGLTAAAGDAQVTLSWTDPGNDTITGYELRVDSGAWADIAGSDADTASHTVTGLTNGTEYSFALRAANASGDGAVSSIAATPRAAVAGVPAAPVGLSATPGDAQVTLSWTDPGDDTIDNYQVSSDGGTSFADIAGSGATTTGHIVTGLTNGTAYTLALRAVNGSGDGAVSSIAATPVAVPAAPLGLTAAAGDAQVTLSWTDPGNDTITGYELRVDSGAWADIAGSDADTASHTVTGLTNGTEYSFALRAANASGDGAVSSIAATPRAAVAGVPAAPVGLSATPGDAQVTLSWTDPGDDTIDNYQVSSDGGTSFADIAGSGATTTGHIVTGLTNGTAYTLALRAANASGDGAVSSIAATPVAVPAAPLGLTAAAGDAQVTLSWTDPGNDTITGYELRVDSGAWADIAGSDADTASHTVTGLTNGTEYSFALRAANASGDGAVSSIAATPRAAVAGVPAAPVGLSATPGDAQVTLSWTDPGDDTIDNYQVSSDGGTSFADIAGSGATTTGHIVTGLTNGTAYTLALRAANASGDGAVSSIAATPVAVPAAPLGLTAAAGDAQVTLSWTDPGNDTITGYELRVDSGAWADIAGSDADTASHTVTGLTNGTEYSFALRAANASGDGAVSSIAATPRAAVAGVPAAPVGLSATPGDAQVTLSWTDPGDATITKYQVSSDGGTSFADIAGSGATTTGHIVTGLTNGTAYTLALRAVNASGTGAVSSIAATPVAVPAAPLGLTAAAGDAQVTLSWTDPGNDTITGYELRVDSGAWADIAGSDADTASHTVTGLTNGTEYSFALRAANASGDGAVSSIAATPRAAVAGVPAAPVGLSATPGDAQVTLSWTDPGDDTIDNYQISSDGGTSFADIAGSGATTTGHIVTGLTNGTAYTLALRAANASGTGAVSSIAATPVAVPAAPLGLTAAAGDAQVTLSWTDPGNDTITGYELRVDSGAWADIAGSDADTASHTVTGLTNGTEYSFALRAANASGDGAVSSIAATPRAAVAGVPAAPVGLSATPGDAQVTLSWTDPGDDTIDNYQVSSDGGTSFADIAGSGATTTGHIVTGLTNGTAYTLALRAANASGDGAVSSIAATPVAVPAAPLGLTAAAGDAQVTLSWTDPGNDTITGYELRVDSGAWADIAGSDADTASHTVTGLTNGTEYSFALRAANASGDGAVSSIAATPRAAVAGVPAAPVGLSATPGDAQVTLSWTDPGDDTIDNYQISSDGGTSFADIAGSGATTTGHIVTGLTNGTAYTLALRAANASGTGAVSSIAATPVAVPAAPLGLTAAAGDAQVTLSWTDPGNDTITGYELRVDSGAWADIAGSDADTASHTVTGLTNGTEYSFALRAANASGDGAVSSIAATPRAAVAGVPAAPVGLSATPGDAQVTLSWTDPGDATITKYQVSSDGGTSFADIAGSGATTTGHIVTGLTNGTAYTLALRAANASGDGAVSSIAATPVAVPAAPLGLTAAAGDAQVTLSWTDPGNDTITGYELRVDSGAWADIAGSDADTASHTVTGLTNGTEYSFALRAANASGDGAVSSIAATPRAAVAGVPAAPVGLSATPGDAQVTLSWTDPGDDTIDNYQVSSDGGTSFADIAGSGATTTGHIVTGLTNGTAYTLALRAVNASGDGAVSSIAATPVAVAAGAVGAPAAPANLTAAAGDAQVTLSWTDPGNDTITGYELRVDSGAWADIAGSDADTASHTVTGLTNGTEYSFALRAANASGDGAVSSIAATPRAAVAAPSDFQATAGDARVTLTWDTADDDSILRWEYRQKESTGGYDAWTAIPDSVPGTTAHAVEPLVNGTAYTFRVRAVNAVGNGPASQEASATPRAGNNPPTVENRLADRRLTAGEMLVVDVSATFDDHDDDELIYTAVSGDPTALTVTVSEATLTLTGEAPGTATVTVTASDDTDSASDAFAVTVEADTQPSLAAIADRTYTRGVEIDVLTLPRSSSGNGVVRYSLSPDPPAGLVFDPVARTLSGTPTAVQAATAYNYTATDADGDTARRSFAIAVRESASATAPPLAPVNFQATAGDARVTLTWDTADDDSILRWEYRQREGTGDYGAWTAIADSGPASTAHAVEALVNGTAYTFQVRAANTAGNGAASQEESATPRAGNNPPTVAAPLADRTLTVGATLTVDVSATFDDHDDDELTYTVVSDDPAAATVALADETLTLTGEAAGTATVTVTASDGSDSASDAFAVTVEADAQPNLAAIADQIYTRGVEIDVLTLPLSSSGNGVVSYSLSPDPPTGLLFDPVARTLSGTPTVAQAASAYTYTATDADGDAAARRFGIEVRASVTATPPLAELKVSFGQAKYTVMEGQQADIAVTMSPAADRRVDVPLAVALLGGTTPEDFSRMPASLVFEQGENRSTISLEVTMDDVNDPGEGIVLSFDNTPEAVSGGEPASTEVHFEQRRMAEQFSQTLEGTLAVIARSTAVSAQTAIEGRFERHRQWNRLGTSVDEMPSSPPASDHGAAALRPGESELMSRDGGRRAEGSGVPRAGTTAQTSATPESGRNSENRETDTPGSWLRNVALGSLGERVGAGQRDSGRSVGSSREPGGNVDGQEQQNGSRIGAPPPGSQDVSGLRDRELNLSGVSFETSLGRQEKETGWAPVLWAQGDMQHFNGDLARLGMDYRGGLEAAHVGLDLFANDRMLAGLSIMRSWGDVKYTDDGTDGVLKSRMDTVHPYLYWQPNERVDLWGIAGLGGGEVDVKEPGRTHDFDADFWMFAGGVRSVLSRQGNNEWSLRADTFITQLGTDASEDIAKVSGGAQRGRVMLEWVHNRELSVGRSLTLKAEAGGRIDEGDADRGAGVETGFRLAYLDANRGLDVALHGRVLAVHESDYRDWGVGLQASWDPGEKQRGFRASVMSSWGQDGGGRTTLWDNADAVMRPVEAMGIGSQYRMETEVAYAGLKAPGLAGLLTPYSRIRWTGYGRELTMGTAWSLSAALPAMLELEAIGRETLTGPVDLGVFLQASIPLGGSRDVISGRGRVSAQAPDPKSIPRGTAESGADGPRATAAAAKPLAEPVSAAQQGANLPADPAPPEPASPDSQPAQTSTRPQGAAPPSITTVRARGEAPVVNVQPTTQTAELQAQAAPPRLEPPRQSPPTATSSDGTAPTVLSNGEMVVQVGAFRSAETAARIADELRQKGHAVIAIDGSDYRRVVVGPFPSRSDAVSAQSQLEQQGYEGYLRADLGHLLERARSLSAAPAPDL